VLCVLLFVVFSAARCRAEQGGGCRAAPRGAFRAFLEETGELAPPVVSVRFRAAVAAVRPEDDLGLRRLVLREADGHERRLAFALPSGALPVREGETYEFQVDVVAGAPGASGVVISDGEGLLFAAASDQRPGLRVLQAGLPGCEIELLPARCPERGREPCIASARNAPLRAARAGRAVTLLHGERAELDGYRVDVLAAQELRYDPACADAGTVALSYAITRLSRD
jgi:catechol 2,3-dioxygenase-like lactoylglutathione lyase family enzyme